MGCGNISVSNWNMNGLHAKTFGCKLDTTDFTLAKKILTSVSYQNAGAAAMVRNI